MNKTLGKKKKVKTKGITPAIIPAVTTELSSDDIALISALVEVVADGLAFLALIKGSEEKAQVTASEGNGSGSGGKT